MNPIALRRIEKLFCKNERAFIRTRFDGPGACAKQRVALVPVAAILIASIRLHFLDIMFHLKYSGQKIFSCDTPFTKGQEIGWFQHGSTIIVLASKGFTLCGDLHQGSEVRVGQALMRWHG